MIESPLVYLGVYAITTVAASVYFVTKLESNTENNKVFFISEMSHLKEFFNEKIAAVTKDITRLEKKQEESNQIKERLAVQESRTKSLHKRIDQHLGASIATEE